MPDLLQTAFIVSIAASALRIAAPLLLAATGELVAERAGILNLGLEGMILLGAFLAFMGTFYSGSLWLGVLFAVVGGILTGWLVAFFVTTLKIDQIIAGLATNLVIAGITTYFFRMAFRNVGLENPAVIARFAPLPIPGLSSIPYLGAVAFSQHWLTYVAYLLMPLVSIFLYRTKYGLELRGIGDNPRAVDMKGVNVARHQYAALAFAGVVAALGGAILTTVSTGIFIPLMSAGRGWIAIAIVIFGNWRPLWIVLGTLFFGLIDAVQLSMQAVGVALPYQLLLALPYLLTIVALVVYRGRSQRPLALGVPYFRE